jgi:hypothetical protein
MHGNDGTDWKGRIQPRAMSGARHDTRSATTKRSESLLGRGAGSGARRPTPGGADPSFPAGSARFQHSVEPSSEGPGRAWRILEAPGRAGLSSTRGQSREQGRDPHCRRGLRRRGRGWSARSCTLSGSRHRLPRRMRVQQQCAVGRRRAPPMTDVLQAGADAMRVVSVEATAARQASSRTRDAPVLTAAPSRGPSRAAPQPTRGLPWRRLRRRILLMPLKMRRGVSRGVSRLPVECACYSDPEMAGTSGDRPLTLHLHTGTVENVI